MKKLQDIKIIIWDVDGTLYKSSPQFSFLIHQKQWHLLARKKAIPLQKAKETIERLRSIYKSGTAILFHQGCGSYAEILKETGRLMTKEFIKRDEELIKVFDRLRAFRHLILANKTKSNVIKTLALLGLPLKTFEKIFTIEEIGVTKPNLQPFKLVLQYTKLPPSEHLMVGDREEIDLLPAKKLGMKTCFVWGKSKIADVSLPTVYNVAEIV